MHEKRFTFRRSIQYIKTSALWVNVEFALEIILFLCSNIHGFAYGESHHYIKLFLHIDRRIFLWITMLCQFQ